MRRKMCKHIYVTVDHAQRVWRILQNRPMLTILLNFVIKSNTVTRGHFPVNDVNTVIVLAIVDIDGALKYNIIQFIKLFILQSVVL